MDENTREIIEIDRDSKYIIIAPSWASPAERERLIFMLNDFINDPNKIFCILSDGYELREVG